MKNINERVFDALKKSRLVHKDETLENVIEKGLIFSKAMRNQQIVDSLKRSNLLDEVSVTGERFSGFGNGILFNIVYYKSV
jgi:CTP-dependent riboflavin kinase